MQVRPGSSIYPAISRFHDLQDNGNNWAYRFEGRLGSDFGQTVSACVTASENSEILANLLVLLEA